MDGEGYPFAGQAIEKSLMGAFLLNKNEEKISSETENYRTNLFL